MSRDELPTSTGTWPAGASHRWVVVSQNDSDRRSSSTVTWRLCPGRRVSWATPASCLGGVGTAVGSWPAYTCATSVPVREPVLVTVNLTRGAFRRVPGMILRLL